MKKVLKTHFEEGKKIQYSLTESEIVLEKEKVSTYGIEISENIALGKKQTAEISDITSDYEKAESLFEKIVRLGADTSSLKSIAEDFILS